MKRTGYLLLQIAGYLILIGGLSDLTMTSVLDSLHPKHLNYLNKENTPLPELNNLHHAFIRAIGSCLIAIGISTLTIIYGPLRKQMQWTLLALLSIVTIGEGGNALQMYLVHSRFFLFPLGCVILTWIGAILWWLGNKDNKDLQ